MAPYTLLCASCSDVLSKNCMYTVVHSCVTTCEFTTDDRKWKDGDVTVTKGSRKRCPDACGKLQFWFHDKKLIQYHKAASAASTQCKNNHWWLLSLKKSYYTKWRAHPVFKKTWLPVVLFPPISYSEPNQPSSQEPEVFPYCLWRSNFTSMSCFVIKSAFQYHALVLIALTDVDTKP